MKTKYHIESVDELLELIKHHNGLPCNLKDEDPKLPDNYKIILSKSFLKLEAEDFIFESHADQSFLIGIFKILNIDIDIHLT